MPDGIEYKPSPQTITPITPSQRAANQTQVTPSASDQWLRKIALVLHDAASPKAQTSATATTTSSSATTHPVARRLRVVAREGAEVELPEVVVSAKATPPSNGQQPAADTSGEGINLTPHGFPQFQVTFSVQRNTTHTPNLLTARIYNLSKETMDKVQQFRKVELSAGYQRGRYGVIFKGNVAQYKRGKENATDTYLEIYAGDADLSINTSVVKGSYPPGTKQTQIIKDGVKQTGIPEGHVEPGKYGDQQLIRSMSFLTSAVDWMRDLSRSANADVYVDMGQFNVVPRDKYVDGEKIVLSPATGLIGIPEVTPQGIQMRCLLNPDIKLGSLIELKVDMISGTPYLPGTVPAGPVSLSDYEAGQAPQQLSVLGPGKQPMPAFTSPTGTYKVIMMHFTGETRGNPWYCDLVCVALNQSGGYIYSRDLPYRRVSSEVDLKSPEEQAKEKAAEKAKDASKPSNPLPSGADPSTTGGT